MAHITYGARVQILGTPQGVQSFGVHSFGVSAPITGSRSLFTGVVINRVEQPYREVWYAGGLTCDSYSGLFSMPSMDTALGPVIYSSRSSTVVIGLNLCIIQVIVIYHYTTKLIFVINLISEQFHGNDDHTK